MTRPALRAVALGIAFAACEPTVGPRRQVLVVVDTDVATVEQVLRDPTISVPATVDTVRVDILDDKDGVRVFREFSATSALDWPLSFALVPAEVGNVAAVRLRVRAFRAREATPDVQDGVSTLTPPAALALDRVVEIPMPSPGSVDARLVRLSGACFGRPASFRDRTSCVDDATPHAPFGAALPPADATAPTAAGSWQLAREVPCASGPREGRVCIPGGMSVLGSTLVSGIEDGVVTQSALPARLVRLSPFFLDRTEFTVGRARKWLSRLSTGPSRRGAPDVEHSEYCTLSDDPSSDALPLNCVSEAAATELCSLEGGLLPTEAQWNHAASGRGDGRRYPWGDVHAGCCNLSAGRRVQGLGFVPECPGEGVEPVGSHGGLGCGGAGDVSRDGVIDLGGSISEMLRDQSQPLEDPCWGDPFGVALDPSCTKRTGGAIGSRGTNWSAGTLTALVALRKRSALSPELGFRCAYPDDRGTP